MDVKELKKNRTLVQYISRDIPPKKGMKRMRYFTSFENNPEKFYWGLSVRGLKYSKEKLEDLVKEGQLVKLINPVNLLLKKEIWLNKSGEIVLANGYAPWKDQEKEIVGLL